MVDISSLVLALFCPMRFVVDELPANRSEEDYGDGGSGGVDENPFPEASVDEHRAQRE